MGKLYLIIFVLALPLLVSGCVSRESTMKPLDVDPGFFDKQVSDEDSVVDELTPIVTIGDEVTVPVYKCSRDTDCNRCNNEDVYTQVCQNGTCQGPLDLAEDCKDTCSAGQCVDEDKFTAEETDNLVGEDFDLMDDDMIIDKDNLLLDETQCSNKIEDCVGYRGIGSAYLTDYPTCECKLIYVPAYCSPLDPPCFDFSSRTDYPECACK